MPRGGVDEAGGDEVDPNRCKLKREGRRERGQRGGGGRDDPQAAAHAPAAGAAQEQQRAPGPHLPAALRATSSASTRWPLIASRTSAESISSRGP